MKALFKLIIVAVVLNAAFRGGMATFRFVQLKESTHSLLALGDQASTEQLQERIVTRAKELKLPVSPENVVVTREGPRTAARVSYRHAIEFFPGLRYPQDFDFNEEISPIR